MRLPVSRGDTLGRAKDIIVKPISAADANRVVRSLHYSGKVVNNSQVHLGVFLDGKCGGALQFGPSLDKRKIKGLVKGTKWNEFIELNRIALADWLPRNGESRAISVSMRLIKKQYPWLKWVVSFADGCQCGDGTIYRASGFVLTMIKTDSNTSFDENGISHHKMKYESNPVSTGYSKITKGKNNWGLFCRVKGWRRAVGFQLRYIYFLDPTARDRLTVPIIPFDEIEKRGASMYRGKRPVSEMVSRPAIQSENGGSIPTTGLKSKKAKLSKK